jgi:hypothetical protein
MIVRYYCNLNTHGKFLNGLRQGDKLAYVAESIVNDNSVFAAAEAAFRYFQRIDIPHQALDAAEAPSISIGDAVLVISSDERTDTWLGVTTVGFEFIPQPEVVAREGRTIAAMLKAENAG